MEKGALATIADKDGSNVLHKACERSNLEMVKLLVSYGASIDEKNKEGKIPMDCCDLKLPDGNKCKGLMFQVACVREEETYGSGSSALNVAKKLQATMTSKFRETAEELEVSHTLNTPSHTNYQHALYATQQHILSYKPSTHRLQIPSTHPLHTSSMHTL